MSKLFEKNLVGTSFMIDKDASKTTFVHINSKKKIIQRCRRMRLEALGVFSYGA
jgi:hypothetical protein